MCCTLAFEVEPVMNSRWRTWRRSFSLWHMRGDETMGKTSIIYVNCPFLCFFQIQGVCQMQLLHFCHLSEAPLCHEKNILNTTA